MIRAIGRLILITLIVIIWLSLAILGMRKIGLNDSFHGLEHEKMKEPFWLIAKVTPTKAEILNALKYSDKITLALEVDRTNDGHWVLINSTKVLGSGSGEVSADALNNSARRLTLADWKIKNVGLLTLDEYSRLNTNASLYLRASRVPAYEFSELLAELKKLKASSLLLDLQNRLNKNLAKETEPLWLYQATASEFARLKFFNALYLETIANLDADFFVSDQIKPRIIEEIERRKLRFLLENDNMDPDQIIKSIHGVITSQPEKWLSKVVTTSKSQ